MSSIRLAVPKTATRGDVFEVKALIRHPMESGYRRGARGEVIPRDIITRFECTYNGDPVFQADLYPGVAANPILTFFVKASASGSLQFTWTDQHGEVWSEAADITVE